jgi:hypothetical protein
MSSQVYGMDYKGLIAHLRIVGTIIHFSLEEIIANNAKPIIMPCLCRGLWHGLQIVNCLLGYWRVHWRVIMPSQAYGKDYKLLIAHLGIGAFTGGD